MYLLLFAIFKDHSNLEAIFLVRLEMICDVIIFFNAEYIFPQIVAVLIEKLNTGKQILV